MTLAYVRPGGFIECPTCAVKSGSPQLCPDCLERRELRRLLLLSGNGDIPQGLRDLLTICDVCRGVPQPSCPEHGR